MLLYLAGSKAVNSRLERLASNFHISEIQLARHGTYAIPIASLHRFSSMRHLSIRFRGDPARIDPFFLVSLASTLETLCLSFNGIYDYFKLPEGHEYASTTEWSDISDKTEHRSSVLSVGKKFPFLQRLLLNDRTFGLKNFNAHFVRNMLSAMPSNLKELEITPLDRMLGDSLVALLPPSLQTLSLSANSALGAFYEMRDASEFDLNGLPPTMTKMQLLIHQMHGILPLHQLPESLVELSMRIYLSPLQDNSFAGLPESVTDLELEISHSAGDIIGLPQSLVRLHLNGLTNPEFGQDPDDHAPSDEIEANDEDDDATPSSPRKSMIASLPRYLETLIIHHMFVRPAYVACFAALPTTLVRLEMTVIIDFTALEDMDHMISYNHGDFGFLANLTNLRTLLVCRTTNDSRMTSGDCSENDTSGITKPLPPSLTNLNWSWNKATVLNSHFMRSLPSGLKHLRIGEYQVHPSIMEGSSYPSGLETLILDESAQGDLLRYLPNLPPSVRVLSIVESSPMIRETIPSNLTQLALTFKLSPSLLSSLPSTLHSLKITRDATFSNESVKFLPSSLSCLELNTDNSLTDECAPFLPRQLTILALPANVHFSVLGVSKLPRSITSLRLRLITFPSPFPFKTVYEAINTLPPDVNLQCITNSVAIRRWAENALFPTPLAM